MVFKKCTRCFKEKDLNSYYCKKDGKYGKDSVCIQCNIEKHAINKIVKSYQFDYTSKICKTCCREKDVEEFYKIAGGKYGRFGTCIQCTSSIRHLKRQTTEYKVLAKKRYTEYYNKNRDHVLHKTRLYREQNKDKYKIWISNWEKNNSEHIKAKKSEWRDSNRGLVGMYAANYRARKRKAHPTWLDEFELFVIEEVYALAAQRTKLLGIDFEVDHIVPLKSDIVCGLHCKDNLQILTASENSRKSNRYWPDMP